MINSQVKDGNNMVEVVFPLPFYKSFTYRLPPNITYTTSLLGSRVKAPFGRRFMCGFIVGDSINESFKTSLPSLGLKQTKEKTPNINSKDETFIRIKQIEQIIDKSSLFTPQIYKTICWASQYYCEPLGKVLDTAMPSVLRQGKNADPIFVTKWSLTEKGRNFDLNRLSSIHQRKVIKLLQENIVSNKNITSPTNPTKSNHKSNQRDEISSSFLNVMKISSRTMEVLKRKEFVKAEKTIKLPSRRFPAVPKVRPQLNNEQQKAVEQVIKSFGSFKCFLLEGVTNSGKTEVYIEIIRRSLEQGNQALYLVPEIALSPQTLERLERSLNIPLALIHSALSPAQRMHNYLWMVRNQVKVLIGTRSAAFTPMAKPGCIIIDEEHDPSYKQNSGFRYNGKHFLIKLASELNVPIVLGSATPSLESFYNARQGKYHHLRLEKKIVEGGNLKASIVPIKDSYQPNNLPVEILDAIERTLAQGSQALVFINRRGFAAMLRCISCNNIIKCISCDRPMTVHKHPPTLACHLCESRYPIPDKCPKCYSSQIIVSGLGTQSIEGILEKKFSGTKIMRIDRDTMKKRGSLSGFYHDIQSHTPYIMVGTQMLAKGHDFTNIGLAVIVNCESALLSNDFHNVERIAQLIIQVIGRVGRRQSVKHNKRTQGGHIIIPMYQESNPILQTLLQHKYALFAKQELDMRQRYKLPPYYFLTYIRAEAVNPDNAYDFLTAIKELASEEAKNHRVRLLGPIESSIPKRLNFYRFALLIKSSSRLSLHRVVKFISLKAQETCPGKIHWHLDIDPLESP